MDPRYMTKRRGILDRLDADLTLNSAFFILLLTNFFNFHQEERYEGKTLG
jgi:hypothetical protein